MASPATLTVVNALTKELYQGSIVEQLQDESIGLKRIESTSEGVVSEVGGKYVTFPIRVQRNEGIGYRQEDETLQDAGSQGYSRVNVGLKYGYGRVKLTGQTMELAETNKQAFASAMDREMQGLKDDLAKDSARIFYGDGSGAFATATGAKTGQVVPVSNVQYFFGQIGAKMDIIAGNGATVGKEHPKYSETESLLNAPLNVYPSGGSLIASGVVVASVDVANSTVTFTGTLGTVANGNLIVRTGNYLREPYGLGALIGTADLFNVATASYPVWKSVMNGNSGTGRALSESLMIKMTDDIRVMGGKTSVIFTPLGVRRAYFNLLTQQRRYTNTKEFAGGLTGLAFNNGREIPVVEDVDAPPSKMWFLEERFIKVYQDKDWNWLDTDGGIWKWVQNKDAFEAVMRKYWQIGLERRNAHGLLSDLNEA